MLELLDQVEDVISVEDSISNDTEAYSSKIHNRNGDGMTVEVDPTVERVAVDLPEDAIRDFSNHNFLVLEVCFTSLIQYYVLVLVMCFILMVL